MIIKQHAELARAVEGKRILHLNSMGKDSVLSLEWLTTFARPAAVVSVHFQFEAQHPDDARYWNYLQRRYPRVRFDSAPNTVEINLQLAGVYQSPLFVNKLVNGLEYESLDRKLQTKEIKERYGCDLICSGMSKYEDFSRRVMLHQKGLLQGDMVYPLGMMTKAEVIGLIRKSGVKLHPVYKTSPGTLDHPSFWKMRASMLAKPAYRESVLQVFPLLVLDQYRFERMLK